MALPGNGLGYQWAKSPLQDKAEQLREILMNIIQTYLADHPELKSNCVFARNPFNLFLFGSTLTGLSSEASDCDLNLVVDPTNELLYSLLRLRSNYDPTQKETSWLYQHSRGLLYEDVLNIMKDEELITAMEGLLGDRLASGIDPRDWLTTRRGVGGIIPQRASFALATFSEDELMRGARLFRTIANLEYEFRRDYDPARLLNLVLPALRRPPSTYPVKVQLIDCISQARVPLLKLMVDDIPVDLTFELSNKAHRNSLLIKTYAEWDPRAHRFLKFLARWRSKLGIGDGSAKFLNSYGWTLLGIHYLQQVGLLPVLHEDEVPMGDGGSLSRVPRERILCGPDGPLLEVLDVREVRSPYRGTDPLEKGAKRLDGDRRKWCPFSDCQAFFEIAQFRMRHIECCPIAVLNEPKKQTYQSFRADVTKGCEDVELDLAEGFFQYYLFLFQWDKESISIRRRPPFPRPSKAQRPWSVEDPYESFESAIPRDLGQIIGQRELHLTIRLMVNTLRCIRMIKKDSERKTDDLPTNSIPSVLPVPGVSETPVVLPTPGQMSKREADSRRSSQLRSFLDQMARTLE